MRKTVLHHQITLEEVAHQRHSLGGRAPCMSNISASLAMRPPKKEHATRGVEEVWQGAEISKLGVRPSKPTRLYITTLHICHIILLRINPVPSKAQHDKVSTTVKINATRCLQNLDHVPSLYLDLHRSCKGFVEHLVALVLIMIYCGMYPSTFGTPV